MMDGLILIDVAGGMSIILSHPQYVADATSATMESIKVFKTIADLAPPPEQSDDEVRDDLRCDDGSQFLSRWFVTSSQNAA